MDPRIETFVCGIKDHSLVPIDIDFSDRVDDPRLLVHYSIEKLLSLSRSDYCYFMAIEDDVLIGDHVLSNVQEFDRDNSLRSVIHPTRIEVIGAKEFPVDIYCMPGKTGRKLRYKGLTLHEYINPHSGILLLSKEKLKLASQEVNMKCTKVFLGGPMASAFARVHSPFVLYRDPSNRLKHVITHIDPLPYSFQSSTLSRLRRYMNRVILSLFESLSIYPARLFYSKEVRDYLKRPVSSINTTLPT